MKKSTIFIPLIKKENLNKEKLKQLDELPFTLYIAYTIQYKKIAQETRDYLNKKGNKIVGFSQVLGCSKLKTNFPILLIGDGKFHALNLLSQGNQVYLFDNNELIKISGKKENKLSKLYSANKVGILISTKPGQNNFAIEKIRQKLRNKKLYLFLADNININELENFPVDFWINTACPGLELDSKKIINYEKLF